LRILPHLSIVLAAFVLIGCSTTINSQMALAPEVRATLKYVDVKIAMHPGQMPDDLMKHFHDSLVSKLAVLPQGSSPAEVDVDVESFHAVTPGERFMIGVLAGADDLVVGVTVKDMAGKVLAKFQVNRSDNQGIYAALYDQAAATVDDTAQGIADTLAGKRAK
jgi:hypothetical protein